MRIEIKKKDWSRLPLETPFKGHVIGDIHGLATALEVALALVDQRGGGTLVTLGDYVDRGPDSLGVLDRLIEAGNHLDLVALAGNHEQLMWQSLCQDEIHPLWRLNGAYTVFGPEVDRPGRAALRDLTGPARCAFLDGLRDYHRVGDLVFVHAGLPPGKGDFDAMLPALTPWRTPGADARACPQLWIRREFLEAKRNPGQVFVVHGHTIHDGVTLRRHCLSVDVGSYTSGRIALVEIDGDRYRPTIITDPDQPARWRAIRR